MDTGFQQLLDKISAIDAKFVSLENKIDTEIASVNSKLIALDANLMATLSVSHTSPSFASTPIAGSTAVCSSANNTVINVSGTMTGSGSPNVSGGVSTGTSVVSHNVSSATVTAGNVSTTTVASATGLVASPTAQVPATPGFHPFNLASQYGVTSPAALGTYNFAYPPPPVVPNLNATSPAQNPIDNTQLHGGFSSNPVVARTTVKPKDNTSITRTSYLEKPKNLIIMPMFDSNDSFDDFILHFESIIDRYNLHGEEVLRLPDCLHTDAFKMYATLDPAVQNDYAALKQAFSTYFRGSQGGSGHYGISGGFPSVLQGDKSIYGFGIECQKVAYDNIRNDPAQRDIMTKTLFINGCSWDIQSFDFYRRTQDPTLQFIDFVGEIIKLHDMCSLTNKGKEKSQVRFQLPEKNAA